MKKNLYDKLGVKKNATKDEIKSAYRKKAKENHPDKGGSKEEMTELTICYSILSSDDKRKKYDETGSTDTANPFEQRFYAFVNQIFIAIIEGNENPYGVDIIDMFKIKTRNIIETLQSNIIDSGQKKTKYENVLGRLTTKGNDSIMMIMNTQIESCTHNINQLKEEIEFLKQAQVVIDHYNYNYDKNVKPKVTYTRIQFGI